MPRRSPRHALDPNKPLLRRLLAVTGSLVIGAATLMVPAASAQPIAGGADCSGFVRWAYYQGFGIDIGSGSADSMIRTSGKFVKVSKPVPGDVVLLGRGGSAPAYHTPPSTSAFATATRHRRPNRPPVSRRRSSTGIPAPAPAISLGYWRYRGRPTAASGWQRG